jgi:ribose 5-phosphate isomerase B
VAGQTADVGATILPQPDTQGGLLAESVPSGIALACRGGYISVLSWSVHSDQADAVREARLGPVRGVLFGSTRTMRIAVASDHRGMKLRAKIVALLKDLEQEVVDVGSCDDQRVDYPDIAALVARKVSQGEVDRGILVCGTGLGMTIVANKFPGVRAAPCHDDLTAEVSRRHNDLNVLCLSGDILGDRLVDRLVDIWLKTEFEGGRHERRVRKIADLEQLNGKLSR